MQYCLFQASDKEASVWGEDVYCTCECERGRLMPSVGGLPTVSHGVDGITLCSLLFLPLHVLWI